MARPLSHTTRLWTSGATSGFFFASGNRCRDEEHQRRKEPSAAPAGKASASADPEQHHQAGHEALCKNEKQAHVRARVEHTFGSSLFGRSSIIIHFKVGNDLLECSLGLAVCVSNIETMVRHGIGRRYAAAGTDEAERLTQKFEAHEAVGSRYSAPAHAPSKRRHGEAAPTAAVNEKKRRAEKQKDCHALARRADWAGRKAFAAAPASAPAADDHGAE